MRTATVVLLSLVATLLVAGVAAGQDLGGFEDTDGDGIPDPPVGFPGDLDVETGGSIGAELQGAVSRVERLEETGTAGEMAGRCGGWAVSYDDEGNVVDAIYRDKDGGPIIDWETEGSAATGMTAANPFVVDSRGAVVYYGELENDAGDGPRNHTWAIKTSGISLDAGGDDNPDGNNRNAGRADLGDNLPVAVTGTVKVTGSLTSENGAFCEGSGFVQFTGPPGIATPIGAAGALFGGIGIVGLLLNSRPAITWKA